MDMDAVLMLDGYGWICRMMDYSDLGVGMYPSIDPP